MEQEQIAGIILCVIGLALSAKPTLVWKIAESWKTEKSKAPSGRLSVVFGIALLLAGKGLWMVTRKYIAWIRGMKRKMLEN